MTLLMCSLCTCSSVAHCRCLIYDSPANSYPLWLSCGTHTTMITNLTVFCSFVYLFLNFCMSAPSIGCFWVTFFHVLKNIPSPADAKRFLFCLFLRFLLILSFYGLSAQLLVYLSHNTLASLKIRTYCTLASRLSIIYFPDRNFVDKSMLGSYKSDCKNTSSNSRLYL